MHEQSPPIRAKKKWDWNRSAMRRKKWRPLTVEHRIECSAPVELICPLTEAKNRSVRAKLQSIAVFCKNEFLDTLPIRLQNRNRQWRSLDAEPKLSSPNLFFIAQFAGAKPF